MTLEPTNFIYMITASQAGSPIIHYAGGEESAIKRFETMIAHRYAPRVFVECKRVASHMSHECPPVCGYPPHSLQATDSLSKTPYLEAHHSPLQALESLQEDRSHSIHASYDTLSPCSRKDTPETT